MRWRIAPLFLIAGLASLTNAEEKKPNLYFPSPETFEMIGAQFLDALIKKGQMEMAKGAFKTQLEVLQKVHPDQFDKYKKLSVDELAADAVLQQAEMAKLQPKTGNAFIDMLNGNGIPIGSSIRGIEDAIRTQKDMENTDPSEQIAKAVLDKFQQQILPGLVANMIAGKNPFKMPQQMRKAQASPQMIREMAMEQQLDPRLQQNLQRMQQPRQLARTRTNYLEEEENQNEEESEPVDNRRELARRLKSSPRLRGLLENAEVQNLLNRRMRDAPLRSSRRPLASLTDEDSEVFDRMRERSQLDQKSQIVLGLHGFSGIDDEEEDEEKLEEEQNSVVGSSFRRAPLRLSSSFVDKLKSNSELSAALDRIKYRVDDVEKYLEPKPFDVNPKPQPGYFAPRKIPTRPRKMLPLLIGADPAKVDEIRRNPSVEWQMAKESRTMQNLKNNPSLAALFMDEKLDKILSGRQLLTNEQKGMQRVKTIKALPRLFGAQTHKPEMIDAKVTQNIEERVVPPLLWEPKGRHTRLRWTGANEKEIPGLGTRFILPSLDPTKPAINSGFSTQGRARDEWDTMFKIPNAWNPGDEVGFKMNSKTKRFVGGNGALDMPALGL